ncbi:MAG: hypothetical protein AMXMBFR4_16020 [Candidatus Hydrogenedentota bacterium]
MKDSAISSQERNDEIIGIILIAITILVFLALVTDGYKSDIRRPIDGMAEAPNLLGKPGAAVAGVASLLFGGAAHILYVVTLIWGGMLLRHRPLDRLAGRIAGAILLLFFAAALLHIDISPDSNGDHAGGIIGGFFGAFLVDQTGMIGANVICTTLVLVGILLSTEFLFVSLFERSRDVFVLVLQVTAAFASRLWSLATQRQLKPTTTAGKIRSRQKGVTVQPRLRDRVEPVVLSAFEEDADGHEELTGPGYDDDDVQPALPAPKERIRIWTNAASDDTRDEGPSEALPFDDVPEIDSDEREGGLPSEFDDAEADEARPPVQFSALRPRPKSTPMPRRKSAVTDELPPDYVYPKKYTRPSIDLFELPVPPPVEDWSEELLKTSSILEDTLQTFGIEARVTDVTRGPTITRYELEPAPGIKVSRFLSLADDIALALKAHRVRVEAPIPGKGRVGIEVPNKLRESVVVRELLESRQFQKHKGVLPLALGKDIAGEVMVTDMAAMPHLLVAGATGAGKTVCVKTLLASLLYAKTPDELQLMLIDPKMVELSIFNDIPHLITPVVTDAKKAASALNWLIVEMEERYRLFAHLRVRNIEVYNQSVENGEIEMVHEEGDEAGESVDAIRKLPYIVCIIDELADLMMLARAEVEDAIARLAQLARAVGIHLIIATQRPSVDVLTGVIKANFPCRISFQVSSRVDSRCILDEIGAERLIGRGDMLYLPAGQSKPNRIQGAFVSDAEMNGLIAYLKTQAPPQYRDEIANFGKSKEQLEDLENEDDELFDEAVRVVLETGQASISMVQRRLRVGYTRAARLIDMMELRGIVGPHSGSKAREILVSTIPPKNEVA